MHCVAIIRFITHLANVILACLIIGAIGVSIRDTKVDGVGKVFKNIYEMNERKKEEEEKSITVCVIHILHLLVFFFRSHFL